MPDKVRISSGVPRLDDMLDGLYIGDNVVWHDESGSLAAAFCLRFIEKSITERKPLVYVSFDRSPRNLVDRLGPLADDPHLTILDCFSSGKGGNSPVFVKFYDEIAPNLKCQIKKVSEPERMDALMDALYSCQSGQENVRFVFESLTGMQELWGGEESIVRFYTHSCPRLYELNTIAYWIMERSAHSLRTRAQINQIAQVVIELVLKRGTSSLSILKAEKRGMEGLNRPCTYWIKDSEIVFDDEKRTGSGVDLGARLRELRMKCGLSQTDLAKMIGVTPSNISQIESNLIYPSIPALLKIAEILAVDVSSFFQQSAQGGKRLVFPLSDAMEMKVPHFSEGAIYTKRLVPADLNPGMEPYLVEIPAEQTLNSHFFSHKGEEMGFVISGKLQIKVGNETYTANAGDVIMLESENPNQWKNVGGETAKLWWIKAKR